LEPGNRHRITVNNVVTPMTCTFFKKETIMNRKMKGLVSGVIVTGVTVALLLCIQGCKKQEPVKPATPKPGTTAPNATTSAKPTGTAAKPVAEPNKPATKSAEPNKVGLKDAAGKVVGEAAKGAAAGAANAAGNIVGGTTTNK
jgi:hypothetical protein